MAALDTNVLVRLLVEDDAAQFAYAKALVGRTQQRDETLFVPVTVMLELEWVLRARYGFAKSVVLKALNALLETRELEFQFEAALERALHAYRNNTADFADCLHAGLCGTQDRAPMLTFDAKAARLDGVQLLGQ